ncbi:hypothetical protein BCR43DRAFT_78538 [Syncephalastrum racemosum]|uniref:Uncharacterized protein n=1 Tax=Syncephalastrum racemosum TaxID=13706 RepID=A0A1X2H2M4_SYNRA|nr:hypothetical protein BCR43DRAFT_78538 [Syncephalastrum racemosum]
MWGEGKRSILNGEIRNANRRPRRDGPETVRSRSRYVVFISYVWIRLRVKTGLCVDEATKTMREGSLKLPKTLKDMLSKIVAAKPSQLRHVKMLGFLINGLQLTPLLLDRLSKRLYLPTVPHKTVGIFDVRGRACNQVDSNPQSCMAAQTNDEEHDQLFPYG